MLPSGTVGRRDNFVSGFNFVKKMEVRLCNLKKGVSFSNLGGGRFLAKFNV